MSYTRTDYYEECIETWASDEGVSLTRDQIASLAGAIQGAHENESQAFYTPSAGPSEADRLRDELRKERSKAVCPECKGTGTSVIHGPCHSGVSQCFKCHGDGRVSP